MLLSPLFNWVRIIYCAHILRYFCRPLGFSKLNEVKHFDCWKWCKQICDEILFLGKFLEIFEIQYWRKPSIISHQLQISRKSADYIKQSLQTGINRKKRLNGICRQLCTESYAIFQLVCQTRTIPVAAIEEEASLFIYCYMFNFAKGRPHGKRIAAVPAAKRYSL